MAESPTPVSPLAAEQLLQLLQNSEEDVAASVLLIDCRPFMAYNESHLHGACNIHFPTIVKRRSKGCVSLENVVQCAETRRRLQEGAYNTVVLYDGSAHVFGVEDMDTKSELYLVLKCLCNSGIKSRIYFVQGGYPQLEEYFPHLCSLGALSLPQHGLTGEEDFWAVDPDQSLYTTSDKDEPHKVLSWLFIGNAGHACSTKLLQALGITAILNVSCKECVPPPLFAYRQIPVEDNASSDLSHFFPEAIQFIESVRETGGKVLVHCQAGVSRSATVCLAYLMQNRGLSLDQAYDLLKSHRNSINPNLNFMRQLLEWETHLSKGKGKDRRVPPLDLGLCNISEGEPMEEGMWPSSMPQEVPTTPTSTKKVFTFDDIPGE